MEEEKQAIEEAEDAAKRMKQAWEDFKTDMMASELAPVQSAQEIQSEYERLLKEAQQGGEEEYQRLMDYVRNVYLPFMKAFSAENDEQYRDLYNKTMKEIAGIIGADWKDSSEDWKKNFEDYLGQSSPTVDKLADISEKFSDYLGSSSDVYKVLADIREALQMASTAQEGAYLRSSGFIYAHKDESVLPMNKLSSLIRLVNSARTTTDTGSSIERAIEAGISRAASYDSDDRPIKLSVQIDGKEIASVVADQVRKGHSRLNKALLSRVRRTS